MNGAPRMAPMPISPAVSGSRPAKTAARMATTGIMVSGSAVPTAASTLPTAPWPRFNRPPRISTAFVKIEAAATIAPSASANSKNTGKGRSLLTSSPASIIAPAREETPHDGAVLESRDGLREEHHPRRSI
jgi:hypothetical protein